MAHDPETVDAFYDDLVPALTKKATGEIAVMAAQLAADEGGDDDLQAWDWRYYDTQLRKTEYGVDPHEVAAYFPLEQVLDGLLDDHGRGLRVDYAPAPDEPVWHPDVRSYAIVDRGQRRSDRRRCTWTSTRARASSATPPRSRSCPGARLPDGTYQQPVSAIVANFTKPTADRPSLLQHDEVVTLLPRVRPHPPPDA